MRRRALFGAAPLLALALGGCAFSFENEDGERNVIGLFGVAHETFDAGATVSGVHRFQFYGLWIDDGLRGTGVAIGEVQLTVADLRNQWTDMPEEASSGMPDDACAAQTGFGFRWCSLPTVQGRAGGLFDIAVAGVSVGVGRNEQHLGVGYHRQTLLEVTKENALVAWPALPAALGTEPAQASMRDLLRGSFNG